MLQVNKMLFKYFVKSFHAFVGITIYFNQKTSPYKRLEKNSNINY